MKSHRLKPEVESDLEVEDKYDNKKSHRHRKVATNATDVTVVEVRQQTLAQILHKEGSRL